MLKLQRFSLWTLSMGCLALVACSAESGTMRDGVGGGSATGGFGGISGTGGVGGISGAGAVGGSGAVGGTGAVGGSGGAGGDSCAAEGAEAMVGLQGADIVWVVDNSCSMAVEAMAVQSNMNRFTTTLKDNGINVNLVLISSAQVSTAGMMCASGDWACIAAMFAGGFNYGVCIAAPFGSGACPMDSVAPYFLHLDMPVGSTNGLQMITDTYPQWSNMMRPGTSKHFVIVTDDDSDVDAATFTQRVSALSPDPTLFAGWRFHGIFSFSQCPDAAKIGTVYDQLVTQTGGVKGDLCTQMFDPVFDLLAMDVADKAEIACDWPIPAPPPGQTLDKNKVNVRYTRPDTTVVDVLRIPPGEDCGDREGWIYDNDETPSQVIACPASCDGFRATGGKVDVLFGCNSLLVE